MNEPKADAKRIFLGALDQEGHDLVLHFLDPARGADGGLRARALELLRAYQDTSNLGLVPVLARAEQAGVGTIRVGTKGIYTDGNLRQRPDQRQRREVPLQRHLSPTRRECGKETS